MATELVKSWRTRPKFLHVAMHPFRRFFSLSEHAKRKVVAKKGGFARGYIKIGGESGSHRLEFKEGFSYG